VGASVSPGLSLPVLPTLPVVSVAERSLACAELAEGPKGAKSKGGSRRKFSCTARPVRIRWDCARGRDTARSAGDATHAHSESIPGMPAYRMPAEIFRSSPLALVM
jgi:hypothetical protein